MHWRFCTEGNVYFNTHFESWNWLQFGLSCHWKAVHSWKKNGMKKKYWDKGSDSRATRGVSLVWESEGWRWRLFEVVKMVQSCADERVLCPKVDHHKTDHQRGSGSGPASLSSPRCQQWINSREGNLEECKEISLDTGPLNSYVISPKEDYVFATLKMPLALSGLHMDEIN